MRSRTSDKRTAKSDPSREGYVGLFDSEIRKMFRDARLLSLRSPAQSFFFARMLRSQGRAARLRAKWAGRGVHVPPVMIVSITSRCNLHCAGCYNRALRSPAEGEMPVEQFRSLLAEARELGVGIAFLAGGEPLLRPEIIEATRDFPDMFFPIFTNGILVDDKWVRRFRSRRNIMAVASIEGSEAETDERRGHGVYSRLKALAEKVRGSGIFWGCSLTVTRSNLSLLIEPEFVARLIDAGCRIFFYVEYVPVAAGTEIMALTPKQNGELIARLDQFRETHPALFIGFPGDEEKFGGCLAAGRGFVHVSTSGAVEACPFAPFSDTSLKDRTLKDAFQSPLLAAIRASHDRLKETRGGCALWAERDWARSLAATPADGRPSTVQRHD
jgi:MoaA/NifB/PqqE/SkfB family radical SAM enzyme